MSTAIIISIIGLAITSAANVAGLCIFAYRQGIWQGRIEATVDNLVKEIHLLREKNTG